MIQIDDPFDDLFVASGELQSADESLVIAIPGGGVNGCSNEIGSVEILQKNQKNSPAIITRPNDYFSCRTMTSNLSRYRINDTVEVFGFLTPCTHLNGKVGTIIRFNPNTMLYTVNLDGRYPTIPEINIRSTAVIITNSSSNNSNSNSSRFCTLSCQCTCLA